MGWTTVQGNADAKTFIAQYPTPKHMREGIAAHGWEIVTAELRRLPYSVYETIGQVISFGVSTADVRYIHVLIEEASRDQQRWVAHDGSITTREI